MLSPETEVYHTAYGALHCLDGLQGMRQLSDGCANLVMTSPPYALHFQKEYGNASQAAYVDWLLPFAHEIKRVLHPQGSFVLNLGGAWQEGVPLRSLYPFRVLLALCDEVGFHLAQEFFWYNPAKLPAPAEWVNVRRIRVKDSVEYLYWLVKDPFAQADNRRVLQPYSADMRRLIRRGVRPATRPSGHAIKAGFASDQGGSIPGNLIQCGNNESNSGYIRRCKKAGRRIHPARFPAEIPRFFIEFLTQPGDLVLDPFAGSNTTGWVAEQLCRRWLAIELSREYAEDSYLRFEVPGESAAPDQLHLPFD